jgi:hypothetical protein
MRKSHLLLQILNGIRDATNLEHSSVAALDVDISRRRCNARNRLLGSFEQLGPRRYFEKVPGGAASYLQMNRVFRSAIDEYFAVGR